MVSDEEVQRLFSPRPDDNPRIGAALTAAMPLASFIRDNVTDADKQRSALSGLRNALSELPLPEPLPPNRVRDTSGTVVGDDQPAE